MGDSGASRRAPRPADPRPELLEAGGKLQIRGGRCSSCGLASTFVPPICSCGQADSVQPCGFGPGGSVFSSTMLEIPMPGRPPPTCLAYIDLDDGPRILARVETGDRPPPTPGDRVSLDGKNDLGDLVVVPDVELVSANKGVSDE